MAFAKPWYHRYLHAFSSSSVPMRRHNRTAREDVSYHCSIIQTHDTEA